MRDKREPQHDPAALQGGRIEGVAPWVPDDAANPYSSGATSTSVGFEVLGGLRLNRKSSG